MITSLFQLMHFDRFGWRSAVDILILTIIVYQILRIFQGTRAVRMLYGILVLVGAYILTTPGRILELPTVNRILGAILLFTPLAIVVLFQNHIRRMLAIFGTNPLSGLTRTPTGERMLNEVVLAAATLASKRHGALIVFEREQGLRSFAEMGNLLDAVVSYDLLTTIFIPNTPLHDGAVIIADGRMRAAGCFLPLSAGARPGREYGSRHRAALGITEETDAIAIVVSEQTGLISLVHDGRIRRGLEPRELGAALMKLLAPPAARQRFPWMRRGAASGPEEAAAATEGETEVAPAGAERGPHSPAERSAHGGAERGSSPGEERTAQGGAGHDAEHGAAEAREEEREADRTGEMGQVGPARREAR